MPSASALLLTGFVVLYGFGGGGVGSSFAAAVACSFPRDRLATLFGCLTMAFGIGAGLGPWVAGILFDSTKSYTTTLYLLMLAAVVAATSVGIGSITAKRSAC
jgi:MFS family permease